MIIKDYFKQLEVEYRDANVKDLASFLTISEETRNIIYRQILEDDEMNFLLNVLRLRLEYLTINDIPYDVLILPYFLNIVTPGEIILYLIEILEFKDENSTVNLNDVCTKIYPNGFYSTRTTTEIIDKIVKPRKTERCNIY